MKNSTKMKAIHTIRTAIAVTTLPAVALALMGCPTEAAQVTREYNDLTFLGKNIKLID